MNYEQNRTGEQEYDYKTGRQTFLLPINHSNKQNLRLITICKSFNFCLVKTKRPFLARGEEKSAF